MDNKTLFKEHFLQPLVACYGAQKFPEVRINSIWDRLKHLPGYVYKQCSEKIILNFDNFPGVQQILNTCAEVSNEYSRAEAEKLKASINCFRCSSQGVIVVNNYSYKCTCQLGELCYPAFPLYRGQVQFQDKEYFEEDGTRVFETANHITRTPKDCRDIRQVRTIVKDFPGLKLVKKEELEMKGLSFEKGPA